MYKRQAGSTQDRDELRRRRKAGLPASATGLPWLIVAPASVVRVWMDHLKLWGHFASFQLESGRDVDVRNYLSHAEMEAWGALLCGAPMRYRNRRKAGGEYSRRFHGTPTSLVFLQGGAWSAWRGSRVRSTGRPISRHANRGALLRLDRLDTVWSGRTMRCKVHSQRQKRCPRVAPRLWAVLRLSLIHI